MEIKSLADFKRFLAKPGVRVQGLAHRYASEFRPAFKADFFAARLVDGVSSTEFRLKPIESVNVSHCAFGKAAEWRFEGDIAENVSYGIKYRLVDAQ